MTKILTYMNNAAPVRMAARTHLFIESVLNHLASTTDGIIAAPWRKINPGAFGT